MAKKLTPKREGERKRKKHEQKENKKQKRT